MSVTVTPDQVESRVRSSLIEFGADPESLSLQARWKDLDVDSLDLVELMQVLEDEYGVRLTADQIKRLPTVGGIIELIVSRLDQ